jgi:hypothetical protein
MSKLSDAYAKLKEALGSDVSGQNATLLADLGSAVEKADKDLADVIKESVGRKDKLGELNDAVTAITKERDELKTKLTESDAKVKEYEPIKTELDTFKANAEKETKDKWAQVHKILKADQKSPLYEKVQKVLKYFKLPEGKEELDIDSIKKNIQVFDQYAETEYFKLPDGSDPARHDKSGKDGDGKEEKKDIGESPFTDMFKAFDPNQT